MRRPPVAGGRWRPPRWWRPAAACRPVRPPAGGRSTATQPEVGDVRGPAARRGPASSSTSLAQRRQVGLSTAARSGFGAEQVVVEPVERPLAAVADAVGLVDHGLSVRASVCGRPQSLLDGRPWSEPSRPAARLAAGARRPRRRAACSGRRGSSSAELLRRRRLGGPLAGRVGRRGEVARGPGVGQRRGAGSGVDRCAVGGRPPVVRLRYRANSTSPANANPARLPSSGSRVRSFSSDGPAGCDEHEHEQERDDDRPGVDDDGRGHQERGGQQQEQPAGAEDDERERDRRAGRVPLRDQHRPEPDGARPRTARTAPCPTSPAIGRAERAGRGHAPSTAAAATSAGDAARDRPPPRPRQQQERTRPRRAPTARASCPTAGCGRDERAGSCGAREVCHKRARCCIRSGGGLSHRLAGVAATATCGPR